MLTLLSHKAWLVSTPFCELFDNFPINAFVAQTVKRLSTMQATQVRSLGWEDPLEKEMAIHSSTIAWKIPWAEEPRRLQSMGSQRVGHDSNFIHSFKVKLISRIL